MRARLNGAKSVRSQLYIQWRVLIAIGLLATAAVVDAQPQGNDYYQATLTNQTTVLLGNVEKYHLEPAIAKMRAGHYSNAHGDIEFILNYFPNHPRALALISDLCDVRWKNARCDSESWFRKAIEVNARAPQTFLANGVHLQRLNRLPAAIESYKRAIALDPASGNAHYNLGLAYVAQSHYELANRHAQIAYALGMPLPGLRDKLIQAGRWTPMDPEQIQRELSRPDGDPNAVSPK